MLTQKRSGRIEANKKDTVSGVSIQNKPKEIRLAKKSLLSGTEYGPLTASRNFLMEILRISFLYGLRLAKTILCLRASPGRSRQVLSAFVSLTSVLAWEQRQRLVVAGYHSTESKSEWISYKW